MFVLDVSYGKVNNIKSQDLVFMFQKQNINLHFT